MANNRSYNLGRFDLDVETPRTTKYRHRRLERDDSSSDSSIENQRWRDNYAQVADILRKINNTSVSDESDTSQSLPGSPAAMPVLSPSNESESSLSPARQVISTSPESTDNDKVQHNINFLTTLLFTVFVNISFIYCKKRKNHRIEKSE